ncbi:MAG TPA: hypothetical protein DER01_18370, partial [Phycisphaerales bacterium]|nr:hypothetical protein [Phycisphaerales bacterium]
VSNCLELDQFNTMPDHSDDHLDTHRLTWAVLLGKWVQFARSAVALPDDEQGRKLRASVPDLIMLQAVWFALQHMDELSAAEQALGLDRATVLVDHHTVQLNAHWQSEDLPQKIEQLITDVRQMLATVNENQQAKNQ